MHADNRAAAEQKLDLAATEAAAVCTECRMSVTTTMLEWRTSVGSDPFPADTPGGRRPQTIRMERRHSQEPTLVDLLAFGDPRHRHLAHRRVGLCRSRAVSLRGRRRRDLAHRTVRLCRGPEAFRLGPRHPG
jgi:hypothetical protein